ncbi:MAG: DNA replication/repair protein RecF [Micavibrio aeruginosavorus]|uniref:DNA replication and repair protein RecF n=1 Tax=Micavibrio aeruginosavorus TaxID=349221 RepID=A0A2W5FN61_9BACT|nr:MAG: DNA replication/repair protein RecF [Micavibrio aeruginosavorus]
MLQNFRSYSEANLQGLASGFIVLTGPNGAGKTNILEAVSLLSPGKGMRSADIDDIQKQQAPLPWVVSAKAETIYGEIALGTGRDPHKKRRMVRIKGEAAKSQAELADYLSCLWLTPVMDRIFLEGSSGRRKFLDRMVFAFDSSHAGRLTRYENALSQRSKLLKEEKNADPSWLDALEDQMAETGIAIAAGRSDFVHRLQVVCDRGEETEFPVADIAISGFVEDRLQSMPAVQVEENFRRQLRSSRGQDSIMGGANAGPHRSDLVVRYRSKKMAADQCSTGEQKALLIGIVNAHATLIKAERGRPPILLLDEIAAHLDENRRAKLFEKLANLGGQVWLTGTDDELFSSIGKGQKFHVGQGGFKPF